jgi:CubicO group peptidase (beta-lactamase class C family)
MIEAAAALLVVVSASSAQSPAAVPTVAPPSAAELKARIDAYVQPFLDDGHLSGTLLVARGPDVLYERSFGMADYENGVPNTPQTRFSVASITKPMTAMIARQLMAENKLSGTDTLQKWIPGFPAGDRITIDHLLEHRAGIPHRVTADDEEAVPRTAADMVELARHHKQLAGPGTQPSYSSGGYSVLARVLELASGQPYDALVAERILIPAGMTRSADATAPGLLPGRARSYVMWPDGVRNAPLKDLSFLVGAGSVYSTPRDLHRLLEAARAGRLGPAARDRVNAGPRLYWNGSTNGFRAFVVSDTASGLTIALASNVMTGALDRIEADVPRLAAGERVAPPSRLASKPFAVSAAQLAAYAGTYLFGTTPFALTVSSGVLVGSGRVLVPTGERTFLSLADYGTVTVVMRPNGTVERLDWSAGERVLTMPRTEAPPPAP